LSNTVFDLYITSSQVVYCVQLLNNSCIVIQVLFQGHARLGRVISCSLSRTFFVYYDALIGEAMTEEQETQDNADFPNDDTTASPAGLGSPMSMPEAQRIVGDRYVLERIAGSGGMGLVYSATDKMLQRRVAIKFLHQRGVAIGPENQRVLSEARTMAGLRHSNLCPVYEVSVESTVPFLVMDWIDGIDLKSAWRGTDLKGRLTLFVKIVEAVGAAHSAGVVHRDLKPTNILVNRKGEPIIVDFGLALSGTSGESSIHTVGGTPGYAAPEQFNKGQHIDFTVDVYALGAIMFEMLTDRLPFTSSNCSIYGAN